MPEQGHRQRAKLERAMADDGGQLRTRRYGYRGRDYFTRRRRFGRFPVGRAYASRHQLAAAPR